MNAAEATLHHLLETRATGAARHDETMNALYQTMRECLLAAIDAQLAGKSQLRALRLALRCAPALIRFGREHPAALPTITELAQVALYLIDSAISVAREQGQDVMGYLSARITCLIQLDRLAALQTHDTSVAPASPQAAPTSQPTAAPAQPPAPSAPHAPAKPLTQRAKWLADQRARQNAKRSSA